MCPEVNDMIVQSLVRVCQPGELSIVLLRDRRPLPPPPQSDSRCRVVVKFQLNAGMPPMCGGPVRLDAGREQRQRVRAVPRRMGVDEGGGPRQLVLL